MSKGLHYSTSLIPISISISINSNRHSFFLLQNLRKYLNYHHHYHNRDQSIKSNQPNHMEPSLAWHGALRMPITFPVIPVVKAPDNPNPQPCTAELTSKVTLRLVFFLVWYVWYVWLNCLGVGGGFSEAEAERMGSKLFNSFIATSCAP